MTDPLERSERHRIAPNGCDPCPYAATIDDTHRVVLEIKTDLAAMRKALAGTEDTAGYGERIRVLEAAERNRGRITWLVTSTAIGALVLAILNVVGVIK